MQLTKATYGIYALFKSLIEDSSLSVDFRAIPNKESIMCDAFVIKMV